MFDSAASSRAAWPDWCSGKALAGYIFFLTYYKIYHLHRGHFQNKTGPEDRQMWKSLLSILYTLWITLSRVRVVNWYKNELNEILVITLSFWISNTDKRATLGKFRCLSQYCHVTSSHSFCMTGYSTLPKPLQPNKLLISCFNQFKGCCFAKMSSKDIHNLWFYGCHQDIRKIQTHGQALRPGLLPRALHQRLAGEPSVVSSRAYDPIVLGFVNFKLKMLSALPYIGEKIDTE